MTMKAIHSEAAPRAVGPYSQAMVCDGMLYASGQIGLIPETGRLAGVDVAAQARQAMRNLSAVLAEAGCSEQDIVKATIFLTDMDDFSEVNGLYAEWLGAHRPARATVAVAALPLGAKVEIEVVARVPKA
ncbi:MAG: RidA family protein [Zetaproteobacteria bacterium]|nr:MAG: RidA family protein [Zetaproteobacteria bacterium]